MDERKHILSKDCWCQPTVENPANLITDDMAIAMLNQSLLDALDAGFTQEQCNDMAVYRRNDMRDIQYTAEKMAELANGLAWASEPARMIRQLQNELAAMTAERDIALQSINADDAFGLIAQLRASEKECAELRLALKYISVQTNVAHMQDTATTTLLRLGEKP